MTAAFVSFSPFGVKKVVGDVSQVDVQNRPSFEKYNPIYVLNNLFLNLIDFNILNVINNTYTRIFFWIMLYLIF